MNRRKFTPRAARLEHIQSFLSSGKSKKFWCQENEIALSTFSKWLKEYKESQNEVPFISLNVSGSESSIPKPATGSSRSSDEILVEIGSCRIHVPEQMGVSFLLQAIKEVNASDVPVR